MRFYEQAYDSFDAGGELWVVIQKKQGAPSRLEKLEVNSLVKCRSCRKE